VDRRRLPAARGRIMLMSSLLAVGVTTAHMVGAPVVEPPPDGGGLWGDVTCESSSAGCELGAGIAGQEDSAPDAPTDSNESERSAPEAEELQSADGSNDLDCETRPATDAIRDSWEAVHGQQLRPDQQLVLLDCGPGDIDWIVQDVEESEPLPDPADVASTARDRLTLPEVQLSMSPVGPQLVGLPTWLWIDPAGWEPVTRSAAVPGVSVSATARPVSVEWSTGDGGSVVCDGPGTPYTAETPPEEPSPDCGYVYRDSSPEGGFTVSATVRWSVTWSGAGESGEFPGLESTASIQVQVDSAPAVNVLPGGAR
jgi:hypothetical protein